MFATAAVLLLVAGIARLALHTLLQLYASLGRQLKRI